MEHLFWLSDEAWAAINPIAPERLLRALLLQAFYTIRSERQLMEQLQYNLVRHSPGAQRITVGGDTPLTRPTSSPTCAR